MDVELRSRKGQRKEEGEKSLRRSRVVFFEAVGSRATEGPEHIFAFTNAVYFANQGDCTHFSLSNFQPFNHMSADLMDCQLYGIQPYVQVPVYMKASSNIRALR